MRNFLFVEGVLTLLLNEESVQVRETHHNYQHVIEALRDDESDDVLFDLINESLVEVGVVPLADGDCDNHVTIRGDDVLVDGVPVHENIRKRVVLQRDAGLPINNLVNYIALMEENPSSTAKEEAYDFLEHLDLPISEDGYIMGYKAVRENWMDKHSGTIDNSIGNTIRMKRNLVSDNRSTGCGKGLHAGSLRYVGSFGGGNDRIIIVKIHPKDIVCIPHDSSCEKMRCCEYQVVAPYRGMMTSGLANEYGEEIVASAVSAYKPDWSTLCNDDDDYDGDEYDYDGDEDGIDEHDVTVW